MSYNDKELELELKDKRVVKLQNINIRSDMKTFIKDAVIPLAKKFKMEESEISIILDELLLLNGIGYIEKTDIDELVLCVKIKDQNQLFSVPFQAWEFLH